MPSHSRSLFRHSSWTRTSLYTISSNKPHPRGDSSPKHRYRIRQHSTKTQSNPEAEAAVHADLGANPVPERPPKFPSVGDQLQHNDLDTGSDTVTCPWAVSSAAHKVILKGIMQYQVALPNFSPPPRCAFVRYLEGYFRGFQNHLPFIHPPTFIPGSVRSELLLAMTAVGAMYRFEYSAGHYLYGAEQPPFSSIQTVQALIILMVMSSWGQKSLIQDSMAMSSQLAFMVREIGVHEPDNATRPNLRWLEWVAHEQRRRTLLVAYIVFNLHSIAFNIPPMILTRKVALNLPSCEAVWNAASSASWERHRVRTALHKRGFTTAMN